MLHSILSLSLLNVIQDHHQQPAVFNSREGASHQRKGVVSQLAHALPHPEQDTVAVRLRATGSTQVSLVPFAVLAGPQRATSAWLDARHPHANDTRNVWTVVDPRGRPLGVVAVVALRLS